MVALPRLLVFVLLVIATGAAVGASYPFNIWLLWFVAFAPLLYIAAHPSTTGGRAIICTSSVILVWFGFLAWQSAGLFSLPEQEVLTFFIRASAAPAAVLVALLWGVYIYCFRLLRTRLVVANALIAAALYVALEYGLQQIFLGYYLGSLAHGVGAWDPLRAVAPLAGSFGVSFVVMWVNATVAEAALTWRSPLRAGLGVALVSVCLCAIFYPLTREQSAPSLSALVLQGLPVSRETTEVDEELRQVLNSAELIVYPHFSTHTFVTLGSTPLLNDGPNYTGALVVQQAPPHATVATWETVEQNGQYFNALVYWKNGVAVAYGPKTALFPFSDYVPDWASSLNYAPYSYPIAPGVRSSPSVDGLRMGGLVCSEVNNPVLGRTSTAGADMLVSIGTEELFGSGIVNEYSLRGAQFRAAENAIPTLKAARVGPSAILDARGNVLAEASAGRNFLASPITLQKGGQTPYAQWGEGPLALLVTSILISGILVRRFAPRPQGL